MPLKFTVEEETTVELQPFLKFLLAPILWLKVFIPASQQKKARRFVLDLAFFILRSFWVLMVWYWMAVCLFETAAGSRYVAAVSLRVSAAYEALPPLDWCLGVVITKLTGLTWAHWISLIYALAIGWQYLTGKDLIQERAVPAPESVPLTVDRESRKEEESERINESSLPPRVRGEINYIQERMMKGSELSPNRACPGFVANVFHREYDSQGQPVDVFVGRCFRVENKLLTAYHCVEDANEVLVEVDGKVIALHARAFNTSRSRDDLAWIELSEKQFSLLGLSKGNLSRETPEGDSQYAHAYGRTDHTIGHVMDSPIFGKVIYTGSTVGGYSGTPYVQHNTIYGMHTGSSSSQNIGISSAYLHLIISEHLESTEDALLDFIARQAKRGRFIPYRSTGDPDLLEVRIGRRYHRVSRDGYMNMVDKHAANIHATQDYPVEGIKESARVSFVDSAADKMSPDDLTYDDSKNSEAAPAKNVNAGAIGRIGASGSVVQTQRMPKLRVIHYSSESEISDTECPEQTRAQRDYLCVDTSTNTIYRVERKKRRRRVNSKPLGKNLPVISEPGKCTSTSAK